MFGAIPSNADDLSIGTTKSYVFIYNTHSTEAAIREKVKDLAAYAKNISVKKDGFSLVVIELTPLYVMKLSAWKTLFGNIGLNSLKDMYVGSSSEAIYKEPQKSIVETTTTYWEPKIKSAASSVGNTLSSAFNYIKWITIAGAVIVGGMVVLTYLPKPRYKENPKRSR